MGQSATERRTRALQVTAALRAHESDLVRYAQRMLGDVELARDVAQESFLRLLTAKNPPADGKTPAWLFAVCRNLAIDRMRKDRRMRTTDDAAALASPAPCPAATAAASETAQQVLAAVATLPETQREVLRLRFQNDFSYKQIAEITGHSVSYVGVLIHDGLTALRTRFATQGLIG